MNQATAFLIQEKLRAYAADCRAAETRLRQTSRLADLVRVADVRPSSIVASIAHCAPEGRQLEAAARRRAQEICEEHLAQLRQMLQTGDREGFEAARGRFRQEWQVLRGHFPLPLQIAERELQRLEHTRDKPSERRGERPAAG